MSAAPPVTWVVAGEASAERWVPVLRRRGLAAGALPWSRARALPIEARTLEAADLVLFTSRHAVEVLPEGIARGRPAACVGVATARAARARGFDVVAVGEAGGEALAAGVLEARPGLARVLFPCARDARPEAREALEAAGVAVQAVAVYEMEGDPGFAGRVASAPEPAAVVLGSPRAVEALAAALAAAGRSLGRDAVLVVLGAVTEERAAALLERYVARAPAPDAESLADAAHAALQAQQNREHEHDA